MRHGNVSTLGKKYEFVVYVYFITGRFLKIEQRNRHEQEYNIAIELVMILLYVFSHHNKIISKHNCVRNGVNKCILNLVRIYSQSKLCINREILCISLLTLNHQLQSRINYLNYINKLQNKARSYKTNSQHI